MELGQEIMFGFSAPGRSGDGIDLATLQRYCPESLLASVLAAQKDAAAAQMQKVFRQSSGRRAVVMAVAYLARDISVRAVLVPVDRYIGNPNYARSVFGCFEAEFCNRRLILQHLSSFTRFACFRTAPSTHVAVFRTNSRMLGDMYVFENNHCF